MKRAHLWSVIILCCTIGASLAFLGDSRLRGQNSDNEALPGEPVEPYVFQLVLEGGSVMEEYTQCFGLGSASDVEENVVRTNAGTAVKQKTPGPLEWDNIVLKRSIPSGLDLWSWRQAMEEGNANLAIRSGSIIMSRRDPPELVAKWDFRRGWAAHLTFDGTVETLTIVHEGIVRVQPEPMHSVR